MILIPITTTTAGTTTKRSTHNNKKAPYHLKYIPNLQTKMSQRPRRSAQPKPYALAEIDFEYVDEEESSVDPYEREDEIEDGPSSEEEEHAHEEEEEDDGDGQMDNSEEGSEESQGEYDQEEEEGEADDDEEEEEEEQGLFTTAAVYHPTSKYEEPVYDMARRYYPSWPMLTLYDIHRRPRRVPSGRWHCSSSMQQVLHAFRCVICLSTLNKPKAVRECMHRFCEDCIEKSLRMGRNECPFCRVFVPSKRNLAEDTSVEQLIANVLGPEFRNLEHEELEDEAADSDDVVAAVDDDASSPRLRRAKRRAVEALQPARKRLKEDDDNKAMAGQASDEDDDDDDEDDDGDGEASVNPPALFDFHLQLHKDEHLLDPLQLPYIRISGDATVKTIIKFVQAKLACDKPLLISTTTGGRKLHESTPLYMLGSLTKSLYYRLPPRTSSSSTRKPM